MKQKQLESIQKQHKTYLTHGIEDKPSMQQYAVRAILNHQPIKLKSAKDITDLLRDKWAADRYSRSEALQIHEIFQSCPEYDAAVKEWKKQDDERQKRVKAYRAKADRILRQAELDDSAEATTVAEQLADLAKEYGLYP